MSPLGQLPFTSNPNGKFPIPLVTRTKTAKVNIFSEDTGNENCTRVLNDPYSIQKFLLYIHFTNKHLIQGAAKTQGVTEHDGFIKQGFQQ